MILAALGSSPLLGAQAVTATPSPAPTSNLQQGINPGDVSPGLLGFLPVFVIALACIGLFLSLTSKLRKVNRRQERLDAQEAAATLLAAGEDGTGEDRTGDDGADTPRPR